MARRQIINALDIGTGAIKVLSVARNPKEDSFEILGKEEISPLGLTRGVVVDPVKVSEAINSLVERVEENSGQKIEDVYAGFGGGHLSSVCASSSVSVSRADNKISQGDVERVINEAKIFPLPSNKEIVAVFPKEYVVDSGEKVKEVVGMEGVKLETNVLAICCFSPYLNNSKQAILRSELQISELIPNPLASARAVLTPKEKELGVVVLDIGAATTDMAIYEEGNLIHLAVFPVGSGHITNDIAVSFKTDIDIAEKIKLDFAGYNPKSDKKKQERKIPLEGEEPLVFSQKELNEIVEARLSDIFSFARKEIKKAQKQGNLPAGVVITGGGAKLPGIKDLVKKNLKLPCRVGAPQANGSLPADPALATSWGLIMEGYSFEEGGNLSGVGGKFKEKIKNFFRSFIP